MLAGHISQAQLDAALAAQGAFPQFTLGQILVFLHNLPQHAIDTVILHRMVLPPYPDSLLARLDALAAKDRFSKGLVPSDFVHDVDYTVESYQTQTVEAHIYDCLTEDDPEDMPPESEHQRFVLTLAKLKTRLTLARGGQMHGVVRVRHHSERRILSIADDDDQLNSTLYYDMKTIWLRGA